MIQSRTWAAALLACLTAAWLVAAVPASAQPGPRFPALTGRVVDQGDLISAAKEAELASTLEALERDTGRQVVVVTVPDLQGYAIEDYGYQLGRVWRIGQEGRNDGALLIVAPNERKVRIEVGYGLEPVLTDALSALIIHDEILPAFREARYEQGVERGVAAIDRQLRLDPEEARARVAAVERPRASLPIGPALVVLAVFVFLALALAGAGGRGRRRRGHGVAPILIWAASEAMRGGGRSSWGGGFGGGGFSGGGGSFGGGGASGGW